jgi:hypothetical protein
MSLDSAKICLIEHQEGNMSLLQLTKRNIINLVFGVGQAHSDALRSP